MCFFFFFFFSSRRRHTRFDCDWSSDVCSSDLSIFGGTLENCEVSIEVANGGFGINYYGDIEGNTSDLPLLGASWCGEIVAHPAGIYIRGGSNNTANKWFREQHLNGVMDRESYYGQKYTVWNDSGANAISGFFRGDSA